MCTSIAILFFASGLYLLSTAQPSLVDKVKLSLDSIKNHHYTQEFIDKYAEDSTRGDIEVSDSIVYISATLLRDDLITFKYGSNLSATQLDSIRIREYLQQLERGKNFRGYTVPALKSLGGDNSDFIVFFSTVHEGNILTAKLLSISKYFPGKDYRTLSMFGEALLFLICFNDEGEIHHFAVSKVQHN